MNRSKNFKITPDNITISLDGHVRPPLSLKSMHDVLCKIFFFVSSSMSIPCMSLFRQHLHFNSGVHSNNFFNPNPATRGIVGLRSASCAVFLFELASPNSDLLFFEISISTSSDCSIIEWTLLEKDLYRNLSWLPFSLAHNWVTNFNKNARSLCAKVDTSRARWLSAKI